MAIHERDPRTDRYRQLEEKVSLWLERFSTELAEPDRLVSALELGRKLAGQALYADALTALQTAFSVARDPLVDRIQQPPPLVAVDSLRESYIAAMPEGRYFEDASGQPFIPVGFNHNPDWQKLMDSNPLLPPGGVLEAPAYEPDVTFSWFNHLHANGVNLIRLMVETPHNGNLENPVGLIQPEHVRWLDNIVLAARASDVRLMVTPYDTFWMNLKWGTSPYCEEIGSKVDWYLKPKLREAQKRRMRFLIDRYGNLDTIFCWELMNEADIWWGASPAQLQAWADDMVPYVREYELSKWGRNHMVTLSTAEPMPKHELADFAFRRPDLDFATTHLYIGKSKSPKDPYGVIETTRQGVEHAFVEIRDKRPYFDGENGPIDKWIKDEETDDAVHHHQSWAHLCSGGAGSSLRWPYRNPHHLTPGMLRNLQSMSRFIEEVDWRKLAEDGVRLGVKWPRGVKGVSFSTEKATIAFAARKSGEAEIPLISEDSRVFDTKRGEWIASNARSGVLSLTQYIEH